MRFVTSVRWIIWTIALCGSGFVVGAAQKGRYWEEPVAWRPEPFAYRAVYEKDAQLPVALSIQPAPTAPVLVEGGVPFRQGVLLKADSIGLLDADGQVSPCQTQALAHWQDGSVKWLEVVFVAGAGQTSWALAPQPSSNQALRKRVPNLSGVSLQLSDAQGDTQFVSNTERPPSFGVIRNRRRFDGGFVRRGEAIRAGITVSRYPGLELTRYHVEIKQINDGHEWHRLLLQIPQPFSRVRNQLEMGARAEGKQVLLIAESSPVDRGVGRTWDVWSGDHPSLPDRPARPSVSPKYLRATGALGYYSLALSNEWWRAFRTSFNKVNAKRLRNDRNFGWRHFGAIFDREHSLAYYGYLNQEYDPATALVLAYGSSGQEKYLTLAEDMAHLFRDMCVSPDGGVYQHRATTNNAKAHVIDTIAAQLARRIDKHPGYRPSDEHLVRVLHQIFGKRYPDVARHSRQHLRGLRAHSFTERRQRVETKIATTIFERKVARLETGIAAKSQLQRPDLRELFEHVFRDPEVREICGGDLDEVFAPFFARYGGSWQEFPAFHIDRHPDERVRHHGGHSLVEMLVWIHFLTGDEHCRRAALAIARHHVDTLIPTMLADLKGKNDPKSGFPGRRLGWPLINCVSLLALTARNEPDLHRQLRRASSALVARMLQVPPHAYQGSIHSGVGMEALARWHEYSQDPDAARYLVHWARYWAKTQWNKKRKNFQYKRDRAMPAGPGMTGLNLYGITYAWRLAPNPLLTARVKQASRSVCTGNSDYAKVFAMLFRSTPRAFELNVDAVSE